MEKITLFFRQGSSNKVYQAAIESKDGLFTVNFAYGRIGNTLQTGSKTSSPVPYDEAKAIYNKLIREKTSKGYTPIEDGTRYQQSDRQATGILPQLLNPIDENQLAVLLTDSHHVMQEKFDGRRLLIRKLGDTVTGINKLGLVVGLPLIIVEEIRVSESDFVIDGEIVGEEYHVFDLLSLDGGDCRLSCYRERFLALTNLMAKFCHLHISLVETAHTPFQKGVLFDQMKVRGREGVVFKQADAVYTSGRPNSGGSQFKFKFHETASFIVSRVNGKRSVALALLDGNVEIPVGNCTIPPRREIPAVGSIVEVRFLYAFRGGSIYQPVFLGVRDDITAGECTLDQLKFKAEGLAA